MHYQLRVIKPASSPVEISLEASSEQQAYSLAEQQGYRVLAVRSQEHVSTLSGLLSKPFPLVLFCQELRVLLEAGLPLTDALDTLLQKESRTDTRQVFVKLLAGVQEGLTLSQAMAMQSTAFPPLFVATVRAAETTGNLPEAMSRYALYLEQIDILKKRIISASIYPAIVMTFGITVLLFLMAYVVPRFSKIYESHVSHLSFTTQLLLDSGRFFDRYGTIVLLIFAMSIFGIISLFYRPETRGNIERLLWRMPYIGEKLRIYHLTRLYRTFSMLLRSGIPVVSGLSMVNSLLGNSLQAHLGRAKHMISEGLSFSEAFSQCGLTTAVAERLFRVGERTGKLELMMERAAVFHEDQMLRWVDAFTKLFEPLLMTVIGIMIGGIVLMMYIPIFELASGLE